jgi:hypothetical protein
MRMACSVLMARNKEHIMNKVKRFVFGMVNGSWLRGFQSAARKAN